MDYAGEPSIITRTLLRGGKTVKVSKRCKEKKTDCSDMLGKWRKEQKKS